MASFPRKRESILLFKTARKAKMDARIAETNRINSERFARIESILMDLVHMMERLPEAVRDKIGFKGATPPT